MLVSDILRSKGTQVFAIGGDALLSAAIQMMRDRKIGALVVEDANGRLAGILSEREVVAALATWGEDALERTVCELMVTPVATARPTDPVHRVMTIMTQGRIRHLPVLDDEIIAGIVSVGDVVKSRLAEKIHENQVLQDIARWPRVA
jgi:CBS domain-containing protein